MMMTMRWRRRLIVLLWLLCIPLQVFCQQLPLRYYSQADGLGSLTVTTLTQEPGGYLWVGTENGLFRYNGARFQRFGLNDGLVDPYITVLHVDVDGSLWAGTIEGLYRRHGQRFIRMQFQNTKFMFYQGQNFASLGANRLLAVNQGRLWQVKSIDQGASWQAQEFFDKEQLLRYPELGELHSIHAGLRGELWMGGGQSLCHYAQGKLEVLGTANGLPEAKWEAILRDRQGTLWVRGGRHVFALQTGGHVFQDRSPAQEAQKKALRLPLLAVDADGRIFSNHDQGVIRWSGTRWESFGESNGLTAGGGVDAILVDLNGGVWLGSQGYGLIHWLGYPDWESWTSRQDLPSNYVMSFLRDREGLFHVGTRSGPAVLQKTGRFSISAGAYGGNSYQWSSMVEDAKGNIWAGSQPGFLVRRELGTNLDSKVVKLPLITDLFLDASGQLWISTERGIYSIRYPASKLAQVKLTGYPSIKDINAFQGCQSRSGALWFVTDKGLLHFDGVNWHPARFRPAVPSFQPSAIACANDGALWLGGLAGKVWRVTEQGDALEINDVTPPLLQDQEVIALHADSRGWLWVATGAGIAVWNRAQWRVFNQDSGLVWNDTNQNALYEDRDGSMWVGTSNGASHILRPQSLFMPSPLELQVESVSRDGQVLPRDQPIRLPWTAGPLNFKLAALSYQNRETLNFRYRMQGLEPDWSKTSIPEVRYPALPPGHYRFQVAADNPAIQSQSSTVEIEVVILPPWWATKTFYAVCGLLLMLSLFFLHRYRVRWLLARQRLKEQMAHERAYELEASREEERKHLTREIHDELGQYLSALRMGVSVMGMEYGSKNPSLQGKIERMVKLVDAIIKVVRNIVSSLRPAALEMGIVSALEWLAEEFAGNTCIPCKLEVCEENIVLDDKRATTIFRIAQESLTNISRHAQASQVEIRLERKGTHYLLEVRDNGKGFDPAIRKKKSFGLIGVRERVLMLGGELDILSASGIGTTVRVSIPVTDEALYEPN
jgi:signal transduction histidine kinase/ligand-binding sensor domain-containing protein